MKTHRHVTHSGTGTAPPRDDKKQLAEFKKTREVIQNLEATEGSLREERTSAKGQHGKGVSLH